MTQPAVSPARYRTRQARLPVDPALAAWVESFDLELSGQGKATKTIHIYTDAALRLGGWVGVHVPGCRDWSTVGKRHLLLYMKWLLSNYARGYANNQFRALQQFWKWYAEEEQVTNPMLGMKPPDVQAPVVPVITVDELSLLIRDAEKARGFDNLRDAAIIRLLSCTGVRLAELAGLVIDDLDIKGRSALVTGKGNKQRVVKFDQKCAVALDRYRRARATHKYAARPEWWLGRLGPLSTDGVGRVIERRGKKLGLHLYPHKFRHTFSHRWLDAGGAEGDLMELNGWESGEMLRRYGRSSRSARAQRAYDRVNVMGGI